MQELSFEQNEAAVFNLAQKSKPNTVTNNRPKLQPRNRNGVEDERPTKDRNELPNNSKSTISDSSINAIARKKINIDENEDTYHNQEEFKKALERGRRLKERMNEALDDDAWR